MCVLKLMNYNISYVQDLVGEAIKQVCTVQYKCHKRYADHSAGIQSKKY